MPIAVVTETEAEKADIVVCCLAGQPRTLDDTADAECADCGSAIFYHRPTTPKLPPKVCLDCALKRIEADKATQAKEAHDA